MSLQTAIFIWLMALTPSKHDTESYSEREDRMLVVARAITLESERNLTVAAAAMAIVKHESHLDRKVHSGEKLADSGNSVCLMMIHKRGLRDNELWNTLAGTDLAATRRCVGAGLMLWGRYWGCYRRAEAGQRWEAMMSAYGTGAGCKIESTGRAKAKTFRSALSHLYRQTALVFLKKPVH